VSLSIRRSPSHCDLLAPLIIIIIIIIFLFVLPLLASIKGAEHKHIESTTCNAK
jgi:hypothetical protein